MHAYIYIYISYIQIIVMNLYKQVDYGTLYTYSYSRVGNNNYNDKSYMTQTK